MGHFCCCCGFYAPVPQLRPVSLIRARVTTVSIGHVRASLSSVTLTQSALSSPRAAEPGDAAFCRSARARSFYKRPGFHAALFPFGISR